MRHYSRKFTVGMIAFGFVVIAALTVGLVVGLGSGEKETAPTFSVDHEKNTFLLDGQAFRYVAGSFHYFRAVPEAWSTRLKTMRAAGLNAVDTYVEWALHNPHDGIYKWDGIADIVKFIELASAEDFYVILRPGPYICAERDNGGHPHWLFSKYPDIKLRTNDANYKNEVAIWYEQLMPRLEPYLYGNGGKIIMVQVENEYGVYHACDHDYLNWLHDETSKYVNDKALLFTTDIPNERMHCGKIDGVFATTDFGIDRIHEIDDIWKMLRDIQPTGPLVNSEFYPGWLTHWQEENQRRDGTLVAESLKTILSYGASVNFYMFFGGTNFGFTAGANDWGHGNYTPDITSYDYDAVMDEAGGITTKYELVRSVIADHFDIPKIEITYARRLSYGQVELEGIASLISDVGRTNLANGDSIESPFPKSFEELDLYSGLVLYETTLPQFEIDPTLLTVRALRDRAFVFVDEQLVGTLSRENAIYAIPISNGWGKRLQLLVENQGRINFNITDDTKGIFGQISLQKLNGEQQELSNWTSTPYPLNDKDIEKIVEKYKQNVLPSSYQDSKERILRKGPVIFYGEFTITEIGDTYLNTDGWGKGVAYLNGFNLGRYWPLAGPQLTMYVPHELLLMGKNTLVLLEYQRVQRSNDSTAIPFAQFDDVAQLDK